SANWSAPTRKTGSSKRRSRSVSTVRACGSSSTSSSGNAARASASLTSAAVATSLCPGWATTRTTKRSKPNRARASRTSATWPTCGGSKTAPKRPVTGTRSSPRRRRPRLPPVHPRPRGPLRAPPRPADGRPLCTRGPGAGSGTAGRAARRARRSGPVDEEVGHGLLVGHDLDRWRDEREERAPEVLDAFPCRTGERKHGEDPIVVDAEPGVRRDVDLVQDDDLRKLVQVV